MAVTNLAVNGMEKKTGVVNLDVVDDFDGRHRIEPLVNLKESLKGEPRDRIDDPHITLFSDRA